MPKKEYKNTTTFSLGKTHSALAPLGERHGLQPNREQTLSIIVFSVM